MKLDGARFAGCVQMSLQCTKMLMQAFTPGMQAVPALLHSPQNNLRRCTVLPRTAASTVLHTQHSAAAVVPRDTRQSCSKDASCQQHIRRFTNSGVPTQQHTRHGWVHRAECLWIALTQLQTMREAPLIECGRLGCRQLCPGHCRCVRDAFVGGVRACITTAAPHPSQTAPQYKKAC